MRPPAALREIELSQPLVPSTQPPVSSPYATSPNSTAALTLAIPGSTSS
jgi:hypothetical protein